MAVKEKNNDFGMLPQNVEAEEAVLGAILVNPNRKAFINLHTGIFTKPCFNYLILMKE